MRLQHEGFVLRLSRIESMQRIVVHGMLLCVPMLTVLPGVGRARWPRRSFQGRIKRARLRARDSLSRFTRVTVSVNEFFKHMK
jgi:hypothetical protein